ncbi:hypothetical protein NL478_28270, partial [Klebsiella pneumoniae]|nr:hypothetical protein [Klebsiella pneumoniae]
NSSENEMEAENVGNKESNKANQGNDMATKRKEEDAGITSSVRQNLAEPVDLSMGADSRKRVPLSRESSFKLDTEKG